MSRQIHKQVYTPIGKYLQQERERAGVTRNQVEVALGYISSTNSLRGTALCYRWEEGSALPTKEAYERLRTFLNNGHTNEYLRQDYEELRQDYEELRRPFSSRPGISLRMSGRLLPCNPSRENIPARSPSRYSHRWCAPLHGQETRCWIVAPGVGVRWKPPSG